MIHLAVAVILCFVTWTQIDALMDMKRNAHTDDTITISSVHKIREHIPHLVLSLTLTVYFFIQYFTK